MIWNNIELPDKNIYFQDDDIIYNEDCIEVLKRLGDNSIDAIVTDPPYGLEFMGKEWDKFGAEIKGFSNKEKGGLGGYKNHIRYGKSTLGGFQDFCYQWATECLRVIKPGGNLLAFGGTRTSHRMVCAIEDAGFEIRDCIMWVYGCLSEDTEVLTLRGYIPFHKLTKCDIIRVYDIENDIYKWETPERWQVYRVHEDTVYRITSDSTEQLVSRNHNCLVKREGKLVFRRAEELADMEIMPVLSGDIPDQCKKQGDVLLSAVQWAGEGAGMESSRPRGACLLDRREQSQLSAQNERCEQSSLERWSNLLQDTRQLQGREICAMPAGLHPNGSERRLCYGASSIGSTEARQTTIKNRSGASRQSRPDRQQPKSVAICEQPRPQTIRGGTSYKTTLARVYQEQYTGILFCPTVSTGAFVARRNGKIFITGNSGFPKSLNIGKAVDKLQGNKREVIRLRTDGNKGGGANTYDDDSYIWDKPFNDTKGTSEWEGYGTGLKPAYEPIVLAMKPLDGTFAENCLKWGVGGLNIDGCRVGTEDDFGRGGVRERTRGYVGIKSDDVIPALPASPLGRFPANFIHDGSQEVMELFPETKSGKVKEGYKRHTNSCFIQGNESQLSGFGDSGSAARFFYCAKASKKERDAGLEDTLEQKGVRSNAPRESEEIKTQMRHNNHPTVKPLALMEYLIKLVTRPGHIVLDPFCGSGTTLLACKKLGIQAIGIEANEEYCEIAKKRLAQSVMKLE